MKTTIPGQVIGIPFSSAAYPIKSSSSKGYLPDSSSQYQITYPQENGSPSFKINKVDSVLNRMNKLGKKANKFVHGVREHVRLGPKMTETVKGKLSLGVRILQLGGVEKVFKRLFRAREGEKLLKVAQCYLSTTAGPIAGLLFISTHTVAFCSERSIKFSSSNGEFLRFHYKVLIPLEKIKRVEQGENVKKPSEKYLEIVTVDNFDFWFMGFLNYERAFKCLQQGISNAIHTKDRRDRVAALLAFKETVQHLDTLKSLGLFDGA